MPKAKATKTVTATERTRVNFGKIPETMELPNLIAEPCPWPAEA